MLTHLNNKRALVRVDFNVPIDSDGTITDDTRIRMALPTILHLLNEGASVILMSHLGRPLKKKLPDGSIDRARFSLRPVAEHLSGLLDKPVSFAEDCIGQAVVQKVSELKSGQVLLLENTRFYEQETKGDPEFAKQLASFGDIYINDAFGAAHREHASTATVARFFAKNHKSFGFLMEKELESAKKLLENPQTPVVAIIGGAKVSDKIGLLEALLESTSEILIGGAMAYTFIKARGGNVGNSLVEEDKYELALSLLEKAGKKNVRIHLPSDSIAASAFAADAQTRITPSDNIPENWMGLDIGPEAIREFTSVIDHAGSILWNGPMGVFEMPAFAQGTMAIAEAVSKSTTTNGAYSLVGGGDSVAAINQSGLQNDISFISTGGGAMLELLEGKVLPGVAAILS